MDAENSADVFKALLKGQSGLGNGGTDAKQATGFYLLSGSPSVSAQLSRETVRQNFRLVEPAFPLPGSVKRHRDENRLFGGAELRMIKPNARQQLTQSQTQSLAALKFQQ